MPHWPPEGDGFSPEEWNRSRWGLEQGLEPHPSEAAGVPGQRRPTQNSSPVPGWYPRPHGESRSRPSCSGVQSQALPSVSGVGSSLLLPTVTLTQSELTAFQ